MGTQSVGEYIRHQRETRGWSQRKLALEAGISNTEVSRLERGDRIQPSPELLKALANALGVSHETLMVMVGHLDPADEELEKAYKRLPPRVKEMLMDAQGLEWIRLACSMHDAGLPLKQTQELLERIIALWAAREGHKGAHDHSR